MNMLIRVESVIESDDIVVNKAFRRITCGGYVNYDGEHECMHYDISGGGDVIECEDCVCCPATYSGNLDPRLTYTGNEKRARKLRMFRKRNLVGRSRYIR